MIRFTSANTAEGPTFRYEVRDRVVFEAQNSLRFKHPMFGAVLYTQFMKNGEGPTAYLTTPNDMPIIATVTEYLIGKYALDDVTREIRKAVYFHAAADIVTMLRLETESVQEVGLMTVADMFQRYADRNDTKAKFGFEATDTWVNVTFGSNLQGIILEFDMTDMTRNGRACWHLSKGSAVRADGSLNDRASILSVFEALDKVQRHMTAALPEEPVCRSLREMAMQEAEEIDLLVTPVSVNPRARPGLYALSEGPPRK